MKSNFLILRWNSSVFQRDIIFSSLLFLYFFTLSADLFNIVIGIFKFKLNHLIAFLLILFFSITQKWIFERRIFFSCLLLLFSFFLSAFCSVYWMRSFTYVGILFFNLFAYFWLSFSLMMSQSKDRFLEIYFWAFKCLGIYAVAQFLLFLLDIRDPFVTQTVAVFFARAQGFAYEPSFYALFMTPFIFFYNTKFLVEGAPLRGKNLYKVIGVNLFLIVSTSTGGFFSYLVFWLMMIFASFFSLVRQISPRIVRGLFRWTISFVSIFISIFLIAPRLFLDSFFKFFVAGFVGHGSFQFRWDGLVSAWNLFLEHPWFGVGVGGVGPYFFQQSGLEGSGDMSEETLQNLEMLDPTNAFTELLASLGLFGLLCFTLFGYFYLRRFFFVLKEETFSMEEKKMVFSLLISVIIMVISLQFNQGLLRTYIWAHLGICLGYVEFMIWNKREEIQV